jgi:hypothetical protein
MNKGKVDNWGYEIEMQHRNTVGNDFSYYIKGNYNFSRNRIIEKDDVENMDYWLKEAGYRLNQFRGYQVIGFFKDEEDIANSPSQAGLGGVIKPGDLKYFDYNENRVIDDKDMIPMGYSRLPEITYSITPGFAWKGFDMSVMFQGVANTSLMLTGNAGFEFYGSAGGGQATAKHLNYWTPDNTSPSYPALHVGAHSNKLPNSFHLQSADFLRLKNIQIGYSFPKKLTRTFGASDLRIYLNGANLYTWTDVENFDPEMINTSGDIYPQQRVINLGLTINF